MASALLAPRPPPPTATLSLMGAVRLRTADGRDLTPRGQKARGALALLGTAAGLRLPRPRLQDKLWSDRAPQQGADSLRQVLRELRLALGEEASLLVGGAGWVGLDAARVAVDLAPVRDAGGAAQDFAADLDIPDPEFEDWLRDMRLSLAEGRGAVAAAAPAPVPWSVVLGRAEGTDARARLVADMVLNEAAARACEMLPGELVEDAPGARPPGTRLTAFAAQEGGGSVALLVVVASLGRGVRLWSHRFTLPLATGSAPVALAVARIAAALVDAAARTAPAEVGLFPLADIFSMHRPRLLAAEARLAELSEGPHAATALALRAYLRNTLLIERLVPEPEAMFDEAEALLDRAAGLAPQQATILAVRSLLASLRRDPTGAFAFAREAARIDPGNEIVGQALAQALGESGRHAEALRRATRGAVGPLSAEARPSWLLRRAVSEMRIGRIAAAEVTTAEALAFAPESRPGLRFLAALRFHRGDEAGAAEALARLRRLEADFSLELMASPAYPVSTLRAAGLLGITRSGL